MKAGAGKKKDVKAHIREQGNNTFLISGELDMSSVAGILHQASTLLEKGSSQLVFDLNEVSRSDSAGLALLVEWLQQAELKNIPLKFINLPAQMLAIARASGLEDVLSLDENAGE